MVVAGTGTARGYRSAPVPSFGVRAGAGRAAFIELRPNGDGSFGFVAVEGAIDYRVEEEAGEEILRFSWTGFGENDPASGRGWLRRVTTDRIEGHFYFQRGDESAFAAHRSD